MSPSSLASLCIALLIGALVGCATDRISPSERSESERARQVQWTLTGRVVHVEDDDTLTIVGDLGKSVVRLSDYDSPEISHGPDRPGQRFGPDAKRSLTELAPIESECRLECYETDRYQRSICHVFVQGRNVNLEQLRRGWGVTPRKREWVRQLDSYFVEQDARAEGRGLWAAATRIHPEDWRRQCWGAKQCPTE